MNTNLTRAAVVGALGGLLFGFDTAVISGTTHSVTIAFGLFAPIDPKR
jgi:MFS transporter, SP family, arabinose:H+ symporter